MDTANRIVQNKENNMFNTRTYQDRQEVLKDLQYDLIQIEQEIDDEWELENSDHDRINQLEHARARICQEIEEIKMVMESAE
jgi:hypothetical protein